MTGMRQLIDAAAVTLTAAGVNSPATDAAQLAAHLAGVDRGRVLFAEPPDPAFVDRYHDLIAARARRIPLQHLTGYAAFGPVNLAVGPGVFIPRPETEALLEWAMAQPLPAECPVIVDLCTGSGALALALAHHRPQARVVAVDASAEALAYTRRNAADTAVEVRHADVTDPNLLADLRGGVDLVVANPPYIPAGAELEPEVAQHDPPTALFGGPDGMAVIAAVVERAVQLMRPGGRCGIEHDDSTSAQTVAMVDRAGAFIDVTAHHDLTGRPRFVSATRTGHREGLPR